MKIFKPNKKENTRKLKELSMLEELNELKSQVIQLQREKISLLEQNKQLKKERKEYQSEKPKRKSIRVSKKS